MSAKSPSTVGMWRMAAILLAACVVLSFVCQEAPAYDYIAHEIIVDYSGVLFNAFRPGREPINYALCLEIGARHEDDVDHVFGHSDPLGQGVMGTHFWDADRGPLDGVTLAGLTATYENAYQKVTGYGTAAEHANWALWQQATSFYADGDKWNAYERLGHISHLIADMSVPAHTHEDAHNPDYFEAMMDANAGAWLPYMDQKQLAQGLIPIPKPYSNDFYGVLYYLMYTTNQRADFFASASNASEPWTGYSGDPFDPAGLVSYADWEPQMWYYQDGAHLDTHLWFCPVDGKLGNIGGGIYLCPEHNTWMALASPPLVIALRYTTVYAVRATATLLDYWDRTVVNPVVPEPGSCLLLAMGLGLLLRRRPR